jgi:hypothetical protein
MGDEGVGHGMRAGGRIRGGAQEDEGVGHGRIAAGSNSPMTLAPLAASIRAYSLPKPADMKGHRGHQPQHCLTTPHSPFPAPVTSATRPSNLKNLAIAPSLVPRAICRAFPTSSYQLPIWPLIIGNAH